MTATTRVALYLRQSLDAAGDGLAIERQRQACRKIAADRGWTVVGEFVDNSVSASGDRARPGYDQLRAAYASDTFDALLCWDLDRLTRQPRQLEDWIDAATERGLLLVTANGEADLSTDAGRLFARIKASVARSEIERKAARQRAAALQRAELGQPPLGTRLTGYTPAGEVIEAEAAVVRTIFERFAAGDSLRSLAAWLTETGVPARRGGHRWNPSTVRTMLRNPRYAGRAVYNGAPNGKAGTWPPLVAPDVFDAVADRLADPRRKTNRYGTDRKHTGAGLYECASCRRRLYAWSGNRYRCPGGCLTRAQGDIDRMVLRVVRGRLARPDLADLLPSADAGQARQLTEEIRQLERRLEAIGEDYDAGRIDGHRYAVATDKTRAALLAARSARAKLTTTGGASTVLAAADPVAAFDAAPLMIRRNVIDTLCTIRIGPAPRGRREFDPGTLGESRWTGDPQTWAEHWRADGLPG